MRRSILFMLCFSLLGNGLAAQSGPYRIVVADNTCYLPGSPVFTGSGYLCVSEANYSMYRDFVYRGVGIAREMVQPSRTAPLPVAFRQPLNGQTVTLNELISARRKDFSLCRAECSSLLSSALSNLISTEIVLNDSLSDNRDLCAGVFVWRQSEPFLQGNGETPGSVQAVEKGRYDKEELRGFVVANRKADLLLVLDTCWFRVDLCSAYSSRKIDRNTSGTVVLSLYGVWDAYAGNELQRCIELPSRMDTIRMDWTDVPLYSNRLPKMNDLVSRLLLKSARGTIRSLAEAADGR